MLIDTHLLSADRSTEGNGNEFGVSEWERSCTNFPTFGGAATKQCNGGCHAVVEPRKHSF